MNQSIISILLGQVIRHGLTALAALLAGYGVTVTPEQAESWISSTTAVVVAIVLLFVSQIGAWISKRNALEADPKDARKALKEI